MSTVRTARLVRTALLLVAAIITTQLSGQTIVTGELTGTITDPQTAVVVDAKVTLKSDDTGETKEEASGATGTFRFSLLRPGAYTLSVLAPGTHCLYWLPDSAKLFKKQPSA
jgi:hypothetical protein